MSAAFVSILSIFFFAKDLQTASLFGAFVAGSFLVMMAMVKLMHKVAPHHGQRLMMVILTVAAGVIAEHLIKLPAFLGAGAYLLLPVEEKDKKITNLSWGKIATRGFSVFALMTILGGFLQGLSLRYNVLSSEFPVILMGVLFAAFFAWRNQPGAEKERLAS